MFWVMGLLFVAVFVLLGGVVQFADRLTKKKGAP